MDNEHKLDTDISQAFPWGVSVVTFDEEDDPDDYERSWTVVIPRVLADIYDIAYLTVPIRSVLKLVADANPRDAHRILALRDAYYGGDSESDYECYATENINRTMTHEERAMVKAARAKGFEEREAARVAFEEKWRCRSRNPSR